MKRILSITTIFVTAFIVLSAFSIRENPQDPPRGKKTEKHIKMVKVDDKGNKVKLDTVITGDQIFVWNGDTIGGKELKWISEDKFNVDSFHQNFDMDFEYEIQNGGEGNVIIMKSGKDGKHVLHEYKMEGDNMMWKTDEGENMFFAAPGAPHSIRGPKAMFFGKPKKENIIDLSDPGIISFKKKINKDGTEKITIVRKQPKEEDIELEEEIIIHGSDDVMFHPGNHPNPTRVKIIKSDDGKVEVIEDENVWHVKEGDANVKVIEEDGKVITIKEIKKDGEKNVEVNVEVKKEEKENN